MMENQPVTNQHFYKDLFTAINLEGGFSEVLLTDDSGLPIFSSSNETEDTEITAAIVSKIQQSVFITKDHLQMTDLEEISLYDNQGKRLIIRPFKAGSSTMFLAILMPKKSLTYKRLLKKTLREVTRNWEI
jgi:predicted regulator of Ras-like GTPase activity (Roadblock/LC7/MglB family)